MRDQAAGFYLAENVQFRGYPLEVGVVCGDEAMRPACNGSTMVSLAGAAGRPGFRGVMQDFDATVPSAVRPGRFSVMRSLYSLESGRLKSISCRGRRQGMNTELSMLDLGTIPDAAAHSFQRSSRHPTNAGSTVRLTDTNTPTCMSICVELRAASHMTNA